MPQASVASESAVTGGSLSAGLAKGGGPSGWSAGVVIGESLGTVVRLLSILAFGMPLGDQSILKCKKPATTAAGYELVASASEDRPRARDIKVAASRCPRLPVRWR